MKVRVDTTRCTGHAQCAAHAPDVYVLDDYGSCAADGHIVPAAMEEAVREGAIACPERVIALEEDE